MTNIEALIFDLDGVIVDTAVFHFKAWKRLADELNIPFTEEDNEKLKGVSRVKSLQIILELGGVELPEEKQVELREKKNSWFVEYISEMTPGDILPGVKEFIEKQKASGKKIALGSASKNAVTVLKNVQLLDVFDTIVDGTNVSKAKPDPEVFLSGAAALGVAPEHCVVFEDAEAGVEAALNGGMFCVGIGEATILGKAHYVAPSIGEMDFDSYSFKAAAV